MGSYANIGGDIAPILAGMVFGLHIHIITGNGDIVRVGDGNGRTVWLARVTSQDIPYSPDHYLATIPITLT
jgi:hypothetical protein